MLNYIYLKNFSLDLIKNITQEYIDTNYHDTSLSVDILMKNSRTFFIRFSENLAQEELIDWLMQYQNTPIENERERIIEGYQKINQLEYQIYFNQNDLYAINSNQETFKIEDFEELISIPSLGIQFSRTEIPEKKIHLISTISKHLPKKSWWKFW